jgi:hypothetical protein
MSYKIPRVDLGIFLTSANPVLTSANPERDRCFQGQYLLIFENVLRFKKFD